MRLVKEYLCNNRIPSDEEIKECISIVENEENCIVELKWFFPYNGWHKLYVEKGMTFEQCKAKLPKAYPI